MNKDIFLRKDYKTYKPKFKMLCREKRIETEKIILVKFVQSKDIHYISQIIITEKK